ncbi:SpoIIE family protein phosphatase [Streptomyces sp. NPDC006476]
MIVGDVEGHNVPAAAARGQLRSAMRAFATGTRVPVAPLSPAPARS